ncbi:MAG: hydroxymethylbilane synthase [Pirellulaceae bacterium]
MTNAPAASETTRRIRLGTRSSPLARWQAEWVAAQLRGLGATVELVWITTTGDVTDRSLMAVGGQGLFTKEIQRALLDDRIDLAVHSLKDLPTDPVPGLALIAVPPREDCADVLVSPRADTLDSLPPQAVVGTGSRRRRSQLLHLRCDLRVGDVRGNVETRLRKLDEGQYDALVLAKAGLLRLGLEHRIGQVLPVSLMLPAVGQGALGLEARAEDESTAAVVRQLNDAATYEAVLAERAMLARLRAGCLAPVGAWARTAQAELYLTGCVLTADGQQKLSVTSSRAGGTAQGLGESVADQLLSLGAARLIQAARDT